MDIAVVGCGASLSLESDLKTVASARVSLGAVAPTPLLVEEAASDVDRASVFTAELLKKRQRRPKRQPAPFPICAERQTIAGTWSVSSLAGLC